MNSQFAKDVAAGLLAKPKQLPSKYFYNEVGDKLFVEITKMPEYYLTRAEFEIFSQQKRQIVNAISQPQTFDLWELGAGDGSKTIELLKAFENNKICYKPIDISGHALKVLSKRIHTELPNLQIQPAQGEYFEVLQKIGKTKPKSILFLGSNLGNMTDEIAATFLKEISQTMMQGDKLLLGLDLIKSKEIVLPAYDDKQGLTSQFNLNLLRRINDELGGNFSLAQFIHEAEYDETTGIAKSYLVSSQFQIVTIKALDLTLSFSKGERIQTEMSRKYNETILGGLLVGTDLEITHQFTDGQGFFTDFVIEKISN